MNKLTIITALAAIATLSSCGVDPTRATKALEAQGVTKVKIGGTPWFGCGQEDSFSSEFTGVGVNGQPISGVVCSGAFKGVTIRYD